VSFAPDPRGDAERPFRGRDRDVEALGECRQRRVCEATEVRDALAGGGRHLPREPGATVPREVRVHERGPEPSMHAGILVDRTVQTIEVA